MLACSLFHPRSSPPPLPLVVCVNVLSEIRPLSAVSGNLLRICEQFVKCTVSHKNVMRVDNDSDVVVLKVLFIFSFFSLYSVTCTRFLSLNSTAGIHSRVLYLRPS